jgi:hypothetical protein
MFDLTILFVFAIGVLVGHFKLIDFEYIRSLTNLAVFERRYVVYCEIYPKKGNLLKHNCIVNLPILVHKLDYETILKQVRLALVQVKPDDPSFIADSTIMIISMNILH